MRARCSPSRRAAARARPIASAATTKRPISRWFARSAPSSTHWRPDPRIGRREELIAFVADRPGHDLRYAIDPGKIAAELGWRPRETFETGLRKTVAWYLDNRDWWERIRSGVYRGERLGVVA